MAPELIPTTKGIAASSLICFIIVFIVLSRIAWTKIVDPREARKHFALFSLAYFPICFLILIIFQAIFDINVALRLAEIGICSILMPYLSNVVLYMFGIHKRFRWTGPELMWKIKTSIGRSFRKKKQ